MNNKLIATDDSSEASISSDDFAMSVSGTTKVKSEKGLYSFHDLMLVA